MNYRLLLILISIYSTFGYTQKPSREFYEKILNGKNLQVDTLKVEEYYKLTHKISKTLFKVSNNDLIKNVTIRNKSKLVLSNGYCFEISYDKIDSIEASIKTIAKMYETQHSIMDTTYKEIVNDFGTGVIIAIMPKQKRTILFYISPCIYKKNAGRVLSILKSNKDIQYIFGIECGGPELFKRYK